MGSQTTIWRIAAGLFAVLFLAPALASAQSAGFRYKVKSAVEKGKGHPAIILRATGDVAEGTVHLSRSDGKEFTKNIGSMSSGESKSIPIDQPAGTYEYNVRLSGKGAEGEEIDTSFTAKMSVVDKLDLWVNKNRAEVAAGKLTMKGSRPIKKVHVRVRNDHGRVVHEGMIDIGGKRGKFSVKWPQTKDVAAVELKAYDMHGFWRGMKLEPFWVKIPHEEVRFKFGKATWDDAEIPKLKDSLEAIREAMKKHGDKGLKMQLYIAGYTDTVGSKSSNRKLSRKRARAIGKWFEENGLDVNIYYQGFGEDVLAVQTPDETKKKANRRALYILGNARPPTSGAIPRSNWKRLR